VGKRRVEEAIDELSEEVLRELGPAERVQLMFRAVGADRDR
jgi:hypothetical protein